MAGFAFLLTVNTPAWLGTARVPLFISHNRLVAIRSLPRAAAPWALDSGAYTQVTSYGGFSTSARGYARCTRRYRDEVGRMVWASCQDWMTEPEALRATGMTIERHQQLTVASFLELSSIAPDLPWLPVLQGQTIADYERCLRLFEGAGVDLRRFPSVGLGSVCRRQGTIEVERIVRELAGYGLRLHAFGAKKTGLRRYVDAVVSSDSNAWSARARWAAADGTALPSDRNSLAYALRWREELLVELGL
jgi:hypothetical protein